MTNRSGQNYTEPYGPVQETTWWDAYDTGTSSDTSNGYVSRGRGYVMYMAEKVDPPSFDEPGIIDFSVAGTNGGNMRSVTEALNWELSGRNEDFWKGYWYGYTLASASTKSEFIGRVRTNLFDFGSPVVVFLYTYKDSDTHLPNWSRNVKHAIAIVGYNNSTEKLTYVDTCGRDCNGSGNNTNGGTHTMDWSEMWELMRAWSSGGYIG